MSNLITVGCIFSDKNLLLHFWKRGMLYRLGTYCTYVPACLQVQFQKFFRTFFPLKLQCLLSLFISKPFFHVHNCILWEGEEKERERGDNEEEEENGAKRETEMQFIIIEREVFFLLLSFRQKP